MKMVLLLYYVKVLYASSGSRLFICHLLNAITAHHCQYPTPTPSLQPTPPRSTRLPICELAVYN